MKQLELDLYIDLDSYYESWYQITSNANLTISSLTGATINWQGPKSIEQRLDAIENRLAIIDESQVPELGMLRDIYNKYKFVEALAKQRKETDE
jgi:hypothetical protein